MTVVRFATGYLPLNGTNEPRPYKKEKMDRKENRKLN